MLSLGLNRKNYNKYYLQVGDVRCTSIFDDVLFMWPLPLFLGVATCFQRTPAYRYYSLMRIYILKHKCNVNWGYILWTFAFFRAFAGLNQFGEIQTSTTFSYNLYSLHDEHYAIVHHNNLVYIIQDFNFANVPQFTDNTQKWLWVKIYAARDIEMLDFLYSPMHPVTQIASGSCLPCYYPDSWLSEWLSPRWRAAAVFLTGIRLLLSNCKNGQK